MSQGRGAPPPPSQGPPGHLSRREQWRKFTASRRIIEGALCMEGLYPSETAQREHSTLARSASQFMLLHFPCLAFIVDCAITA